MRVLLTGGSGMVGRNIKAIAGSQCDILAPSSSELNLMDEAATRHYLTQTKPDIVVHAAGRVGGIHANMRNPVAFLEQNLAIGRNIIMGAHDAGVTRFLNLASTCMYPRDGQNPLKEDAILTGRLEPTNEGYAIAKIAATRLCQYIRQEEPDLDYKTLIPCNLYGFFDSFDPARSHLVPAIIHKVHMAKISGADQVEIWGDGQARREFMFASDLAQAVLRAAAQISTLPDLMNVGLGRDHSVNDYYQAAAHVIGWKGTFTHDLSKPTGMRQKLCDTTRLETWGWAAPTSLEEGLALTYEHYLESQKS